MLYAAFGEGNKALEKLNGLFALTLRPNTMYMESGPVIETPLSGAQCVHDMLLQSWGKNTRISSCTFAVEKYPVQGFTDRRGFPCVCCS